MKKIDWEVLVNHLTGASSEIEEKAFSDWLSESEENRQFYERIRKMWSAQPGELPELDTERALDHVLSRIRQSSPAAQRKLVSVPIPTRRKPVLNFFTRPYLVRAAAAIVVVVGAIYVLTILTSKREGERISFTFNSMQTLELSDGTRATFDVGSSFAYDKNFAKARAREVFLDGEAYFEVAKNDKSHFIIHAGIGRIEVLGTKFNVRAWEGTKQVVVAVQEGRVSFQTEGNDDTSQVVYLSKDRASRLIEGKSPTPPEEIDISKYLSWMKREFYFQNTPVQEVLNQLERWYNVKVEIADSAMLKDNVTVFIENKPLAENLDLISVVMNVQYVQRGDTIRFVPR